MSMPWPMRFRGRKPLHTAGAAGGTVFPAFTKESVHMFSLGQLIRFLLMLALGVGWMLPDVLRWRRR